MDIKATFSSMLEEDNGGTSMIRVVGLIWTMAIAVPFVYLTFKQQTFPNMPDWTLYVIFGTLGLKVLQKPFEKSNESTQTQSTKTESVTTELSKVIPAKPV